MNTHSHAAAIAWTFLACSLAQAQPGKVPAKPDSPVTLAAGAQWVPLKLDLDIEAGSALDFSMQGFQDAPAGKHGWVKATAGGHFVFEKDSRQLPRRFYGVNLCFTGQYVSHEQADRLAERLARLGYNAVRLHHYEGELISGQTDSVTFNPERLDQLDYLTAAFFKRGLYVTTDLYVSRPIRKSEIGLPGAGNVGMDEFKYLLPVHARAFENWKAFARRLMTHVNPYTHRRWADEPALAWIALVNEGNLGNFAGALGKVPEWNAAWNRWLADRYAGRDALARAWGRELKETEDAARGTVAMTSNIYGGGPRTRDTVVFLAHMEKDFYLRAAGFLRKDLGVKALLTNMSSWTNHAAAQEARGAFDFVDDHFYVDHPQFLEQSWRLPSRCPNTSPIAGGASGGRHCAFTRMLGKPFTITEYNYSAPGRFRGVGGILTGAMGALQDWSGLWRFAYSHSRQTLSAPGPMNYFDMATDPLGQAAERASMCLFLRRDVQPAPTQFAVSLDPVKTAALAHIPGLAPDWHWMAWLAGVGTLSAEHEGAAAATLLVGPRTGEGGGFLKTAATLPGLDPYKADRAALLARLPPGNPSDPARNLFRSPNGEVVIDASKDTLVLDTRRTAGGYAPAGQTIATTHGVEIALRDSDATAWVSSLDARPIAASRRLLFSHLTDLQNTDIRYAEASRQTLLSWGRLPHLVRAGQARVRLTLNDPAAFKVWALATSGRRVAAVPARVEGGALVFTADVAGFKDHGAVMCYEIAPE